MKVKVIRQHDKGICSRQLAAEFGVGKTQVNNIVTAKAGILKLWDDGVNGWRKLVAARKCPYVDLNAKVFDWFCSARARNIPLVAQFGLVKLCAVDQQLWVPQARDLIQSHCRKAIGSRRQVSITDFFDNQ